MYKFSRLSIIMLALLALVLLATVTTLFALHANPPPQELSPQQIYDQSSKSICALLITRKDMRVAYGTGFFVSRNGKIAVSKHAIAQPLSISVMCGIHSGSPKSIAQHPDKDIAIIDSGFADTHPLPVSDADPHRLIGQKIYIIGNSNGIDHMFGTGVILGFDTQQGKIAMHLDIPLAHGDSGSPILLGNGAVIGILANRQETPGKEDVYFAVPVVALKEIPGYGSPSQDRH